MVLTPHFECAHVSRASAHEVDTGGGEVARLASILSVPRHFPLWRVREAARAPKLASTPEAAGNLDVRLHRYLGTGRAIASRLSRASGPITSTTARVWLTLSYHHRHLIYLVQRVWRIGGDARASSRWSAVGRLTSPSRQREERTRRDMTCAHTSEQERRRQPQDTHDGDNHRCGERGCARDGAWSPWH